MDQAKKDLEEATNFVREKHLVTLGSGTNLQVIPTPEFMRGIYSVAGFNAAPALEPQLGAFYWVTPIPPDMPKARVESKLREYNRYGMMEITIHEAMPGHYVQFEFANAVEPKSRRVLRSIYGNGPYVEGWALYTQQMMSDEGFMNNSPELRLTHDEAAAAVHRQRDSRHPAANHGHDRAAGAGSDDERHLPGKRRGHRQIPARAVVVLPASDVFHRLARLAGHARGVQEAQRARPSSLQQFHDAALKESAVPLPALGSLLQ